MIRYVNKLLALILTSICLLLLPSVDMAAECGDIDCSGSPSPDIGDVTILTNHLYTDHQPLCDPSSANVDGVAGVTNNDYLVYIDLTMLDPRPEELDCSGIAPDYPLSNDLLEFRNATVPPNTSDWTVEIWLNSESGYGGLSLALDYTCPSSPVTVQDVAFHIDNLVHSDWDNVTQSMTCQFRTIDGNVMPSGSHLVATIDLSVAPTTDEQTIAFAYSEYPPSHRTVISRWGADGVVGTLPMIPEPLSCGNVDGAIPENVDVGDLTALLDYLFISTIPPAGLSVADVDNYAGVTFGDYVSLYDYLFQSFTPLDCEPEFDEYPNIGDLVEFRNTVAPAGTGTWEVEMWVTAVDPFAGFSLPFTWSSSAADPELTGMTIEVTGDDSYASFDNAIDRALPAVLSSTDVVPAGEVLVATFTFEVPVLGVDQEITCELSDYPPSHIPLLIRRGGGGVSSYSVSRGGGCYANGDTNGDDVVDLSDLIALVAFLYQGGPAPDPLYSVDINPDCVIDTFDIQVLADWLYVSLPLVDSVLTCCDPEVWVPGEEVKALGDAIVTVEQKAAGRILVEEVIDDDGVRLYTDQLTSEGYRMAVENVDLSQEYAALNIELRGRVPDADSTILQMLAGVGVASAGGALGTAQIYADFRPIGDTTVWVQTWQAGTMIDQDTLTQYGVIGIVEDVGFGLPSVVAVDMFASDPPAFRILFSNIAGFHLANDSVYQGSEIRLLASQSTKEIVDLYSVDIYGSALGWFALSDFTKDACCRGFTGNVDDDPTDFVDISDLTMLIDYLFISFTEPSCMSEAQLDGIDEVDGGDLSRMIQFLFIDYSPPEVCPEE